MGPESVTIVNHDILLFAIVLVAFTMVQALLFMRHALRFNAKHKLFSQDEIKSAIKSSAVISIGPSMSVMIVVLSLIPLLGAAVTFMRCGVIGAADFELINAKLAVETIGVSFDDPNLSKGAFTLAVFGCTLASAPYFLHLILTCKPMDKLALKSVAKKRSFMPMLGMCASLGFLGYWFVDTGCKTTPNTAASVSALLVSLLVGHVSKKVPKLADWSMAIALVCGMIVGSVVNAIVTA
jgi:hypothetical protein